MSTSDTGLLLRLNLDGINDGKVADSSGKGNDGTLHGSPRLVRDDEFGSCLSLNGTTDYITLPPSPAADFSRGLTFEAWVYFTALPDMVHLLDFGNGPNGDNLVLAVKQSGRAVLRLFQGGQFQEYGGEPEITLNRWVHLAAAVDDTGICKIYINGHVADGGWIDQPAGVVRGENFIGRSNWPDSPLFQGRIATVRVYGRARSDDEVAQDMAEDRAAAAVSFPVSHPLHFRLYDREDKRQVIHIDERPQGREMIFEVGNASSGEITLATPAAPEVSAENHHFELRLRAGTLSADALGRLALADDGWSMLKPTPGQVAPDGGVSLYFLSASERVLGSARKITLRLTGVAADPAGGARTTRAQLRLRQTSYPDPAAPPPRTRLQRLNVVDERGQLRVD